jgi:ADP-ribose pyrophosphatase YjhB (NUDIX family)
VSESAATVLVWLLFENEDSVLVAHRKADEPPFAGQWVLPGDVLSKGEAASKLIAFFAKDELDVQVMGDEPFETLHLRVGKDEYAISVHRVGYEGQPRFRDSGPYDQVGWAPTGDLVDRQAFPLLAELAGHLKGAA